MFVLGRIRICFIYNECCLVRGIQTDRRIRIVYFYSAGCYQELAIAIIKETRLPNFNIEV